jgi:hypothetical protein
MTLEAATGQVITFNWKTDYKTSTVNSVSVTCGAAEFADGIGTISGSIGRSCDVRFFSRHVRLLGRGGGNKITLDSCACSRSRAR